MKKLLPILLGTIAVPSLSTSASAALFIYENFDYTLAATSADPDGGLNSNNGLPASGTGVPTGNSTGLRNSWGTAIQVSSGLTYSNAGGTLVTSGNAATITGATSQAPVFVYRNMTTDPFIALRSSTGANFGTAAGTYEVYFSVLMNIGTFNTAPPDRARLQINGAAEMNIGLNTGNEDAIGGGKWTIASAASVTNNSLVNVVANQTTLLVGRYTFSDAVNDVFDLWIDPTLGAALGTSNISVSAANLDFNGLGYRTTVANQLQFDEIRFGTTVADVMPIPEPSTSAMILGGVGMLALLRRRQTR